jgi:DNA-directed RNA polymerase specialized sigma24 family protein
MIEEQFDELRPSAFAIAYRMLGSVSEAEDVVQEGSSASTEHARAASESSGRVAAEGLRDHRRRGPSAL